jgi:hypothetical protein
VTGVFFRVFAAIAGSENEIHPQVASAAALANPINLSRGIRFAKIEDEQIIIFGVPVWRFSRRDASFVRSVLHLPLQRV